MMFDHMKHYVNFVDTKSKAFIVAINKLDKKRRRQKKRNDENEIINEKRKLNVEKRMSKIDE